MADGKIVFELEVDSSGVVTSLKKTEKQAKKTGKKISKSMGSKKLFSGAIKSLTSFKGLLIGAGAALGAFFSARAAIQAAQKQEDAINDLNQALKSTGQFSAAASEDIQNFASALQQQTTVGDETIISMTALAQSYVKTAKEAKFLTKTALDFSEGAGISFEEAIRRLGRGVQGSSGDLANFSPAIRKLTKEQLAAGEATRILAERFEGFAAAQKRTFSGAVQSANNAFGDLLERVGEIITKSPAAIALINKIAATFVTLGNKLAELSKGKDLFKDMANSAIDFALALTRTVGPTIEFIGNIFEKVGKLIGSRVAAIMSILSGEFRMGLTALAEGNKDFLTETLFNFDGTASVENFLEGTRTFVNEVREPVKEAGKDVGEAFSEGAKAPIDEFFAGFKQGTIDAATSFRALGKQVSGTVGKGLVKSFENIGRAWQEGTNVAEAFGKTILSMFGDLALQLGQFYFLLGLANLFLNPAAAAVQLAGGAALIILGGVLKSVAGGGGGASAPSAGGGGGGFGGPAENDLIDQDEEREQPGTAVTVNVQGNILDRKETGLELAEIINESFGSEGVVIAQAGT